MVFVVDHSISVLAQDSFCHKPILITPLAAQHATAVLGEVGVLLDGRAVPDLVLHAVDEHEDGHQRLERGAERLVAREEGDVQLEAVRQKGLPCTTESDRPCLMKRSATQNSPWSESPRTSLRRSRARP